MTSMAAWEIGEDEKPLRIPRDRDFLEKHLETWIERDASLLAGDVRWASRQLSLPDGSRLDLLGLSCDGTWVIVELKPGPPGAGAVDQALHYFMHIASMTDGELGHRIRAHGLSDLATADALDQLAPDAGDSDRNYLLLVGGVGDGAAAQTAADALTRHGFDVPIRVVTFEVLRDSAGRRILVREVEETTSDGPGTASGRSLEDVLALAERCGVRSGFEVIRGFLLDRGYREQRRGRGLNWNLGSRLNWLWVRPADNAVYCEYLSGNFPDLFGIEKSQVEADLGENYIELPPEQAFQRVQRWADVVDRYRQGQAPPPEGESA